MQSLLIILLLVGAAFTQLPAEKPAAARVTSAVAGARQEVETELSQTFVVTDEALSRLKEQGVPETVLRDLSKIRNTKYKGQEKFTAALRDKIGEEQTDKFQDKILKNTRGDLHADRAFD